MLDVVQVQHGVVTHLQCQINALDFFFRGRIRRFAWIEGGDRVTDRRAIDLNKNQPKTIGKVFHQSRLAVTWWTYEEQQTHPIRAFVVPKSTQLLGHVVPDSRQVDLVNKLISDKAC